MRGQLQQWVGEWVGSYDLYFEPGPPVSSSSTEGTVTLVAKGSAVAMTSTWEFQGKPHESVMIVINKPELGDPDIVWIDSFHTGGRFQLFRGVEPPDEVPPGAVCALGSYPAPTGPDWGWRILLSAESPDVLHVTMYNITPDGEEVIAVDSRYRRLGSRDASAAT